VVCCTARLLTVCLPRHGLSRRACGALARCTCSSCCKRPGLLPPGRSVITSHDSFFLVSSAAAPGKILPFPQPGFAVLKEQAFVVALHQGAADSFFVLSAAAAGDDPAVPATEAEEDRLSGDVLPYLREGHQTLTLSALHCMQLQLATILPFLHGALQGLGEKHRSAAIVRSLQRAGNLQTRVDLIQRCRKCAARHEILWDSFPAQ